MPFNFSKMGRTSNEAEKISNSCLNLMPDTFTRKDFIEAGALNPSTATKYIGYLKAKGKIKETSAYKSPREYIKVRQQTV
jgi:hypothetical protein